MDPRYFISPFPIPPHAAGMKKSYIRTGVVLQDVLLTIERIVMHRLQLEVKRRGKSVLVLETEGIQGMNRTSSRA